MIQQVSIDFRPSRILFGIYLKVAKPRILINIQLIAQI